MHPQNDRDERGTVRATGDKHQVVGEHWLGEGVLGALETFCLICVESCGVCMCLLGSLSPPQVQRFPRTQDYVLQGRTRTQSAKGKGTQVQSGDAAQASRRPLPVQPPGRTGFPNHRL